MTTSATPIAPVFNPTSGELDKLAATYATGARLANRALAVHSIKTRAATEGSTISWDELALSVSQSVVAALYSTVPSMVGDMVDNKGTGVSADSLKQAGYAADWVDALGVALGHNKALLGRVVSAWATIPAAARKDFAATVEAGAPAELDGVAVPAMILSERRAAIIEENLAEVLALANADKAAKRAASKAKKIAAELAAAEDAAEHEAFTAGPILDAGLSAYDVIMAAIAVIRDNVDTLDEDDALSVNDALAGLVRLPARV